MQLQRGASATARRTRRRENGMYRNIHASATMIPRKMERIGEQEQRQEEEEESPRKPGARAETPHPPVALLVRSPRVWLVFQRFRTSALPVSPRR